MIDSPAPGDAAVSPLTVTGEGRGYEGTIVVEVRRRTSGAPVVADGFDTAGAGEALAPFSVDLTLPGPNGVAAGAILVARDSSGSELAVPHLTAQLAWLPGATEPPPARPPVVVPRRRPSLTPAPTSSSGRSPSGRSAPTPRPRTGGRPRARATSPGTPTRSRPPRSSPRATSASPRSTRSRRRTCAPTRPGSAWATGRARRYPSPPRPWSTSCGSAPTPTRRGRWSAPATPTSRSTRPATGPASRRRPRSAARSPAWTSAWSCRCASRRRERRSARRRACPRGAWASRGRRRSSWSGASDPALTIVVWTGGHAQGVERFAVTGVPG